MEVDLSEVTNSIEQYLTSIKSTIEDKLAKFQEAVDGRVDQLEASLAKNQESVEEALSFLEENRKQIQHIGVLANQTQEQVARNADRMGELETRLSAQG